MLCEISTQNQVMKTFIKKLFLAPALIAGLGLMLAGHATAQTFTNLHSFTMISSPYYTNGDGAAPLANLILSDNVLYGTAQGGGLGAAGVVFKIHTNGTGCTNVYSFTATSGSPSTNSDGKNPQWDRLILSGNTLYGTAAAGGGSGVGTVFAINTNGTDFTNLHSFTATSGSFPYTNSDGAYPQAGLILSGSTLYGTASQGGSSGKGTVFAVNTDGTGFTNLYSFTATSGSKSTNSDGAGPYASLILSGNTLYGTAAGGGSSGNGTVFAVNTNGSGFTNLHSFTVASAYPYTNSDGVSPYAGLILLSNSLYGTTFYGGSSGWGTLFKVSTDGTGFTNLHSFTALLGSNNTNSDGAGPYAGLVLSGNTLYGTAFNGGSSGKGAVFAINTVGTGFTNLYNFALSQTNSSGVFTNSDGANPSGGLLLLGNTLYGTAYRGGSSGQGTVFSLSLGSVVSVPVFFTVTGKQMVFTWANTNFSLQSAPAVTGIYTNIPGATSPYTNSITGLRGFYRLIAN